MNIINPNQPLSKLELNGEYTAVYPLSSSHLLLASLNRLLIYETVYASVQAELAMPCTILTVVKTSDPLSFTVLVNSKNQIHVLSMTIPKSATLLDAVRHHRMDTSSSQTPSILLPPNTKLKKKDVDLSLKKLFTSLEEAITTNDPQTFDKLFRHFRKEHKANRVLNGTKKSKLTSSFVKDLLALIFHHQNEKGLSLRIYPNETIEFLLDMRLFLPNLLPGGADGLVSAALGNASFLKDLLKKEPSPFSYNDYLKLLKYILETPESEWIVRPSKVLGAFERDVTTFFNRPDMKTVLSLDQLQQLLNLVTQISHPLSYATTLSLIFDSIGLAALLTCSSLHASLIDQLHVAIEDETATISESLEVSSAVSLVLRRLSDTPMSKSGGELKRKIEVGRLNIVAQEDGLEKRRRIWMKKPHQPGEWEKWTPRFIAKNNFQEVAAYSLERVAME